MLKVSQVQDNESYNEIKGIRDADCNKINSLHERCLRIVSNNKQSSVDELLEKDSSVSINVRNTQILATEMYKLINNLSPRIMKRVFKPYSDSRYNLRQISQFFRSLIRSVCHGKVSISYLGPKTWDILPDDYKTTEYLNILKIKMKPENCLCRLYKVYIDRPGFFKNIRSLNYFQIL